MRNEEQYFLIGHTTHLNFIPPYQVVVNISRPTSPVPAIRNPAALSSSNNPGSPRSSSARSSVSATAGGGGGQNITFEDESAETLIGRPRHTFDVIIPSPTLRPPGIADRVVAFVLSGGRARKGEMAGLTGKPLLYFTSIFVSLGVFLFGIPPRPPAWERVLMVGYDQGVMSGIITYVS